jgi:hypothetical protein
MHARQSQLSVSIPRQAGLHTCQTVQCPTLVAFWLELHKQGMELTEGKTSACRGLVQLNMQ